MTELVTSGSVGGMASNGCLYPEVAAHLVAEVRHHRHLADVIETDGRLARISHHPGQTRDFRPRA
jgi:hypothetical protein